MIEFKIRKIEESDQQSVSNFLGEHWGSPQIVTRGKIHQADKLPGFIAVFDDKNLGLITYHVENNECEIVSLNSQLEKSGIGTRLIDTVISECSHCQRVWLITTNDNLHAIQFYQNRGFKIKAIHAGAIAYSRQLKPSIPEIGLNGIPIRDEIEFEYIVSD